VLPGLTVHDITHLDALWAVADEIIGSDFYVSEAEAFVLGGAFLLHDSAHAVYAYEGGLDELKATVEWRDFVAASLSATEPAPGSPGERAALFHVLRALHAHQAERLPEISWEDANGEKQYLIEDTELRNYYGQVIGEIAASHHWDPAVVANRFRNRRLTPPGFMHASSWSVDVLKVAMILRVADAAHIDSGRAPWFLFALRKPEGVSKHHWRFQSKLGKVQRSASGELKITSGAAFKSDESESWWLAWDVATMIDAELKAARLLMQEEGRPVFEAWGVAGTSSADSFAREVPVSGWVPVDVRPKIGDVPFLIERLGGAALYGNRPEVAVRELMQNGIDACRARDTITGSSGGRISIELKLTRPDCWRLSLTDNGIGMSKYVLTQVLLDFGRSLWSNGVTHELPGLASSGFRASGKFGIGFFSVFMLGQNVTIVTRRFERSSDDDSDQWKLEFREGLRGRPSLSVPGPGEKLWQCGARVSVEMSVESLEELLGVPNLNDEEKMFGALTRLVHRLAPASPVDVFISLQSRAETRIIAGNDWTSISDADLISRVMYGRAGVIRGRKLLELYNDKGEIVGRLLPGSRWSYRAIGVLNGIAAADLQGLIGVVEVVGNNINATRTEARMFDQRAQWEDWARRALSEISPKDVDRLLTLNPLLPLEDLPVWHLGVNQCTLAELGTLLATMSSIDVHFGPIAHTDDDEVSSTTFKESFSPHESLVLAPDEHYLLNGNGSSGLGEFPWGLGYSRIDYEGHLRALLDQVWGTYNEDSSYDVVGEAYGAEIFRNITKFSR
jgi:hypothetical protein